MGGGGGGGIVTKESSMTGGVGTYFYCCPELLHRGTKHYGVKVDMYSAGIIFFEMWQPFSTEMERASIFLSKRDESRRTHTHTERERGRERGREGGREGRRREGRRREGRRGEGRRREGRRGEGGRKRERCIIFDANYIF
jgi:Protein kinase domain